MGLVGKWTLHREGAPWFVIDGTTTMNYNADGDLILHQEALLGIKRLGLKRRVDSGFARVNEEGVFRCKHTAKGAHLEVKIRPDSDGNEAVLTCYNADGSTKVTTRWIR